MTTDTVRAGITEKRPFLRSAGKCFLTKNAFYPKKHPKFVKRLIFILEKGTFFFAQCTTFPGRGQNMVSLKKLILFLGQNLGFWPKKNDFCHTTPILVNNPFLALGKSVHCPR